MKEKYITDRNFKEILKAVIGHLDRGTEEKSKFQCHLENAFDTLENDEEDINYFSFPVKEDNPLYKILYFRHPAKNMNDLKERAQTAQDELLDVVLEFFKQTPNECFTAGPITKALGLFKGNDKSNTWLAQSIMNELSNRKDFEDCAPGKGKKYIGNHID